MNLLAHLTTHEGLVLAGVFFLGFVSGAGLFWLVGPNWIGRKR